MEPIACPNRTIRPMPHSETNSASAVTPRHVLGYPVHTGPLPALLARVLTGPDAHGHQHIVTLNPEMLIAGEQDPAFGAILKSANLILPDGAGIVWALKRQGQSVTRVPGIEFSQALLAEAARTGAPVALIGAAPEVNHAAEERLQSQYPGLRVVYAHHGFFTDATDRDAVARACRDSRPRFVFVALGVPGQERWIRQYMDWFESPTVFVGVGGSFDIWSGLKKRAPQLFLTLGLEWLYRITSEPFRIKRVARPLPLFMWRVLTQK